MTNTSKISLPSLDSWVNEQTPLNDVDLVNITGGYRTTKEDCDTAGMKWSKDKQTENDGKGQCRP